MTFARASLARPPRSDNLRGAVLMTLSLAGFTCNDAATKLAMQELPLGQVVFLRGALIVAILGLIAARQGGLALPPLRRDQRLLGWRLLGEVTSTVLYLLALRHMAIGDLVAITQILPIAVMVAAAWLLGEHLGPIRIAGAVVGLAGVLVILRPGTPEFGIWSWVALGAVVMIVQRDISTRLMSRTVRSSTVAFSAAAGVALTGAVLGLFEDWVMPSAGALGLVALASVLLTGGYLAAVAAVRVGDVSFSAPFRYSSLVIAIILGLVVFGEWPDLWTWVGAAMVVGAGLCVLLLGGRRA